MFQDRDAAKGIYEYRNRFDADDKALLLTKPAYHFSMLNKWRFSAKDVLELWEKNLLPNLEKKDLKPLLKEVRQANGILKHLAGKELTFLHRTFQEYFTARAIADRSGDILEDPAIYKQLCEKEWREITFFLVGMVNDASDIILGLHELDTSLSYLCLLYIKRAREEVLHKVSLEKYTKLQETEGEIQTLSLYTKYLAQRHGLTKICSFFAEAFDELEKEASKKRLWLVIDTVMHNFSPQKGINSPQIH